MPTQSPGTDNRALVKGVSFMILSAFSFALMNLFSRLAGPLPATQKAWFRNLIVFVVALAVFINKSRKTGLAKVSRKGFIVLIIRAGVGLIGLIANFYAVDNLPLSDATILAKLAPFFAIIFSYFLLKEKISKVQIITLLMAFFGAVLVVRPTFSNPNLLAYMIGFAGGLFAGLAYTYVRILTTHGISKDLVIMFFGGFAAIFLAPLVIANWEPMSPLTLVLMLLVGLLGTAGQYAMTYAYSYAPASSISIFDYSQVFFSAIFSGIVLQELPAPVSVIGYLVIFAASLILFLVNRRQAKNIQALDKKEELLDDTLLKEKV